MTVKMTLNETYEKILKDPTLNQFTQPGYLRATMNLFTQSQYNSIGASNQMVIDSDFSSQRNKEVDLYVSNVSSLVGVSQNLPISSRHYSKVFELSSKSDKEENEFKVPKAKKKKGFSKFLQENEMLYSTVDSSQGNKIRFIPDVN
jgi:hypothetical protein